jgi:hypothetical protein
MKIEVGNKVLVDLRYEGISWLVVSDEVDEWGEFVAMGEGGEEYTLHVEEVQEVEVF